MNQDVTITVSGPQGVGKSLIAEAISIDLHARGFNHVQVDEEVVDRATPEEAPRVVIHAVRGDRPPITTSQLGLPAKSTGINAFIDEQVIRGQEDDPMGGPPYISADKAAEIARAAVLHVIADPATLINNLVNAVHHGNVRAGWWNDLKTGESLIGKRNFGELLCLVHSEISEAMEGHRKNLPDDKLPHRKMAEVELADAIIRIFDICGGYGFDLGGAFVEKREFNAVRADHKPEARKAAGGKAY